MRLIAAVLLCGLAYGSPRRYDSPSKEIKEKLVAEIVNETLQKKTKAQKEDFESSVEDMVKKDCEALFGTDAEAVATCVTLMIDKIEEYYERIEPMIETKQFCVTIGMCVRREDDVINPVFTSSISPSSSSATSASSSSSVSSSSSLLPTASSSSPVFRAISPKSTPNTSTTSQPADLSSKFPAPTSTIASVSSTFDSVLAKVEKVFNDLF